MMDVMMMDVMMTGDERKCGFSGFQMGVAVTAFVVFVSPVGQVEPTEHPLSL